MGIIRFIFQLVNDEGEIASLAFSLASLAFIFLTQEAQKAQKAQGFLIFVLQEVSAGDAEAAKLRMQALDGIAEIEITEDVEIMAKQLLSQVPLPAKAKVDALHIATATIGGMDYLLTWNCKHIANPALRVKIESVIRATGYEPPVICTPHELLEV